MVVDKHFCLIPLMLAYLSRIGYCQITAQYIIAEGKFLQEFLEDGRLRASEI